jgi:hypothetical protein
MTTDDVTRQTSAPIEQTPTTGPGLSAQDPAPDQPGTHAQLRFLGLETRWIRWVLVTAWMIYVGLHVVRHGVPVDRESLIVYSFTGVLAASIGKRPLWTVVVDWVPFAAILVAYDLTRSTADALGRPTLWHEPVDIDKFMFGGHVPTVWLQEHLKLGHAPWWEVVVSCTYVSYFFAPYVVGGLLWVRNRNLFRRFAIRFVALNIVGLVFFVIIPEAPPWAAAQCDAAQVKGGPSKPNCMFHLVNTPQNGLLGPLHPDHPGASEYVQRIALRGFTSNGFHVAANLLAQAQGTINNVAAMPSLHAGLTLLIAVFLWPIRPKIFRPLLVLYPLVMAFSLVYGAEHYVIDILAGWVCCAVVFVGAHRIEDRLRRKRLARADTLGSTDSDQSAALEISSARP